MPRALQEVNALPAEACLAERRMDPRHATAGASWRGGPAGEC